MNSRRVEHRVAGLSEPISHFTDAVRYGDMVFISGIAPFDERGEVVGTGHVEAQTRQIFQNLQLVLDDIGAGPEDILKVVVYMTDVNERALINPIRQEFFGEFRPASTLIGVAALAVEGMRIEIEAVVGLPS